MTIPDVGQNSDGSKGGDEVADVPGEGLTGKRPRPAREIGGRDGPDPTRYGDWEKNGRCIDF